MKVSLMYIMAAGLLLGTSLCGQSFTATDIPQVFISDSSKVASMRTAAIRFPSITIRRDYN